MAKSTNKKNEPEAVTSATRRDSVGWLFWLVTFAVLAGPAWWGSRESVVESEKGGLVPYVMAFALAAIGAGLLSYTVNLYYRVRTENEKKAARKGKKQARNQ